MGDSGNGDYTEQLISLIKARPALYDKTLLGYNDRPLKRKLWFEICELMTPGWTHHSFNKKLEIESKLQKNWLEIKASFEKELNQQKKLRLLGTGANNLKKKYPYLDKLQFLMPTMNVSPPPSISRQVQNVKPTTVNNRPSYYIPSTSNSQCSTPASVSVQTNKKKRLNKEPYVKILNIQSNKEIDEDKHFLLSLIPSLQKLSSTQKMRAKMKFLQAIHDIEIETQQTAPQCPQSVGNESGYNQPSQLASQPTPCTITSNNIGDQSDPPDMIQNSPRLIQNSPRLIQSSPVLMQRSPSPPQELTNERPLPTVWVKNNSVLLAQPPQTQNSPRIRQSAPSPTPQQTNENQLSTMWAKDNSTILKQSPQQTQNSINIIFED